MYECGHEQHNKTSQVGYLCPTGPKHAGTEWGLPFAYTYVSVDGYFIITAINIHGYHRPIKTVILNLMHYKL